MISGSILNIPPIPAVLIREAMESKNPENYLGVVRGVTNWKLPEWVVQWLNDHVYKGLWQIQEYSGDFKLHIDNTTTDIRFMFMLSLGGENVETVFYDTDGITELHRLRYELHKWGIIRTSMPHEVVGMEEGLVRTCITAPLLSTPWTNG